MAARKKKSGKAAPPRAQGKTLVPARSGAPELKRQLTEARAQQAATAEILKVISRSPADTQPVFEAIIGNAHRLCGPVFSILYRYDGEMMTVVADKQVSAKAGRVLRGLYPAPPRTDHIVGRAILERRVTHTTDLANDPRFSGNRNAFSKALNLRRAALAVPLLRNGVAVGAIAAARLETKAFSRAEIQLLQTFADQAVIAIENVRLFNETQEALERQTATADILRVISGSPTSTQPVFDAIVARAMRLCEAELGSLFLVVGDAITYAHTPLAPDVETHLKKNFPRPVDTTSLVGRSIVECQVVHVPDIADPSAPGNLQAGHLRSQLTVPLLREGSAIGALVVGRRKPGPFSTSQISLLQAFADQAVIAIENARLFNETKEALERQTATAEILKAIAGSPSDVQPVFDAIVRIAMTLVGGFSAAVFRVAEEKLHLAALTSTSVEGDESLRGAFPMPLSAQSMLSRAVRSLEPAVVVDIETAHDNAEEVLERARARGWRSSITVPMIREGVSIAAINVTRRQAGAFSPHHVELLKTFADQAVIAIENVRLFNETREALERQTATAEILKVIASSPSNMQPVLDAIAASTARLCEATDVVIYLRDGDFFANAAHYGDMPIVPMGLRREVSRESTTGRAMLEGRQLHILDLQSEEVEFPEGSAIARDLNNRTVLNTPLLREGIAIGTIALRRTEAKLFSEKHIALVRTFADQAVIAIENVRLFKELQSRTEALTKSVGQLTALGEVGQAISSTLELDKVLQTIVERAVKLTGLDNGSIYEYDENAEEFRLQAADSVADELLETVRRAPIRKGDGTVGGTAVTREPAQVPDILDESYHSSRKDVLVRAGYRAILTVPLLRENRVIGALSVTRKTPGEFAPDIVELLKTFATQSAMAIQNARLFREIAEKGKQLEIASRHKSDFLANMSHELRTPLNAIIGFSEVLMERMFGELNEKQADYMKDIHESGRHLLSLINDILDLSKIEAGRMDLDLGIFDLPSSLANAITLVRERAQRHGIALGLEVDPALGAFTADERKFKQILLNLLSNAVKFTPDGGRVDVSAVLEGKAVAIAVKDTGVGIAAADHAAVFEEFKQVGSDYTRKAEGTGLGLALTRRFVELHGGQIRLESRLGSGSTFTFTLPVRT